MTKVQLMTSHPYVALRESQVMKIVARALEFPMAELQEHVKALSHINLVLSQLHVEVLHSLHMSVTQEIQFRAVSTSMELTKVFVNNDVLQVEYNKLRLERD
jgi:hypothetical protein